MNTSLSRLSLALVLAVSAVAPATAREADRSQPMDVAADQVQGAVTGDGPMTLLGNVLVTQGTLTVDAVKGVLHSRAGSLARALFHGAPVKLSQEMEDGTLMDAVAREVDYDLDTDTAVFTGDVFIKNPRQSMSGEKVTYNLKTGKMSAGGPGAGRVKMHVEPKKKASAPAVPAVPKSAP